MALNFADLEKRAERRTKGKNRTPFVLEIEGDDPIKIPYPDATRSMNYEQATTLREQLRVLTGPEYPRLMDLFDGKPIEVVQIFITSVWEHWNDDSHEVPGGKGD